MDKQKKVEQISYINERFEKSKAIIFAGYRGLKVEEINSLRRELNKKDCSLKVVKNRLAKLALKKMGIEGLDAFFKDPTVMAYSDSEPVNPAKVLVEFAKEHQALQVRGGYLEGKSITFLDVERLSKLPSRELLIAKALSSMLSPATNTVCVLSAVMRGLVCAINGIKEKKQNT